MHLFKAIPLGLLATLLTATAGPRIALVRVTDIYAQLPSTTRLQEEIKAEREKIAQSPKAEELRKKLAELKELQEQVSDRKNQSNDDSSRDLARMYEVKRQEAQALQEDYESYKTETQARINRKMVEGMRFSLNKIVSKAAQIGTERGFISVFDSSGHTNTGVPFMIYSKDATDLTEDVQTAVRSEETVGPADKPAAPASEGQPANPN